MPKFVTVGYGDQQGYSRTIKTIRNPDAAGVETLDRAYMSSALPVAGFAIIEAVDLADAIKKVSTVPCAVAYGVVEV